MATSLLAFVTTTKPADLSDEEYDFQCWLQAVDNGYQGTLQQYNALFDDEGNLI